MHAIRRISALLLGVGLLTPGAIAQEAASARILIDDPTVLESMGFPVDATVYRLERAETFAEAPLSDFGSGDHSSVVAPKAFMARENSNGTEVIYDGGDEGCCVNLTRRGGETFYDAQVSLPTGALLKAFTLYAFDDNVANDLALFVWEVCQPEAGGSTSFLLLADVLTSGSSGGQAVMANLATPITVNNKTCQYTARVRFDDTAQLTLQKVRATWARQVSPAPGTATFGDVPTSSPIFKFVEALVASGITAGCGAGQYCPNDPLTRGQMAVFLAGGLGLDFK